MNENAQPSTSRYTISGCDVRVRIVTAVALVVAMAVIQRPTSLILGAVIAVLLAWLGRIDFQRNAVRFRTIAGMSLLLILILPWTTVGETKLFEYGPLAPTWAGLELGIAVAIKGLIIITCVTSLLDRIDSITLERSLSWLGMPVKLTTIMLFTLKYTDIFHREMQSLSIAMRARGFKPGMNLRTMRYYAFAMGLLLIRSHHRAETVHTAMKCRGFGGHYLRTARAEIPSLRTVDIGFAVIMASFTLSLIVAEIL